MPRGVAAFVGVNGVEGRVGRVVDAAVPPAAVPTRGIPPILWVLSPPPSCILACKRLKRDCAR